MLGGDVSQFGQYNRINSSFNTGADQLLKTIQANFGIPINHVVELDFAGFEDAVTALGGVYLDFNYPAKDAFSHVWSLCVEEHFYLLLPLIVLLMTRKPSLPRRTVAPPMPSSRTFCTIASYSCSFPNRSDFSC